MHRIVRALRPPLARPATELTVRPVPVVPWRLATGIVRGTGRAGSRPRRETGRRFRYTSPGSGAGSVRSTGAARGGGGPGRSRRRDGAARRSVPPWRCSRRGRRAAATVRSAPYLQVHIW